MFNSNDYVGICMVIAFATSAYVIFDATKNKAEPWRNRMIQYCISLVLVFLGYLLSGQLK